MKFYPQKYVNTYKNWLENIQDWCISRQLWWGHRIPAYYYDEEKKTIYFHGANKGMRWDYMMERPKVSFCVVDMDQNDPENYSTNFRSAICYGTSRVVDEEEEYYDALVKLTTKFVKGVHTAEEIVKQIDIERAQCGVTAIDIEFITGKEAIELVQAKKGMEK